MRTIKFRAWEDTHKVMIPNVGVHPHILEFHEDYKGYEEGSHTVCPRALNYHIMQFTGLTDKNGKEIYEGDIVKHLNGQCYEIIFQSARGCFGCNWNATAVPPSDSERWEVIGNIYENPELLEGK